MEPPSKTSSSSLFQVYLRLRPNISQIQPSLYPQLTTSERFLTVEPAPEDSDRSTHITIHPPSESRKRAVEKFAFTKVFEEDTTQLEIFDGTGAVSLVEGVLLEGRDGLLATLGVTGSGKSHTILGSKAQRGLTQLCLDLIFRSLKDKTLHPASSPSLVASLAAADASEAQILPASGFLDGVFGDVPPERGASRAATPMIVGTKISHIKKSSNVGFWRQWSILGLDRDSVSRGGTPEIAPSDEIKIEEKPARATVVSHQKEPFIVPVTGSAFMSRLPARSNAKEHLCYSQELANGHQPTPRKPMHPKPSALPNLPDISSFNVSSSSNMEYSILVSMYEVYNDRIFDLLCHPKNLKDLRRRPLLFKSTERSPDRKVVAGLRKIVCGSYEEALMVIETGLAERRVAGTGSNSVSSRSHGFFCVEVRKRPKGGMSNAWTGAQLTVVDLAGSERARNAKTAGATLAEAGKINESLMYLGQCLQMQSDAGDGSKTLVPFRQCKLTELLFSNSFPSAHQTASTSHPGYQHRNAQKAVMIVTADPLGDFNATSQILRYSALAREVTVPRIPSISSTILKGLGAFSLSNTGTGRSSPTDLSIELENVTAEAERLNDEVEILALRLAEEQLRRREAEEGWQRVAEQAEQLELRIREECFAEMELRIGEERRRWMNVWTEEADRNDEHVDRKMEILARGIVQVHEDAPLSSVANAGRIADLEAENDALRHSLETLQREIHCRSPTKSRPSARALDLDDDKENLTLKTLGDDGRIDLSQAVDVLLPESPLIMPMVVQKTPGRRVRKLTPKFVTLGGELGDDDDDVDVNGVGLGF